MSIIIPKNDSRIYKHIILKNDLSVLIINDPNTITSAAALSVKVGFYNDNSVNINGIAHFLEHMLFMGTEKYPEVNHFMSFLNKGGGYTNAYTSGDITNYYFDINNEYFEEALDIFGNFFISPLFDENTINKELNAVNEEYAKNFSYDLFKQNMVIRTLAKDHVYNHFACGNKKTLEISNIRDLVIEFYKTNYSSNLMNLVIYTNNNNIEKIIKKIFTLIPNKNLQQEIPKGPLRLPITTYNFKKIYTNLPLKVEIIPNNNIDNLYIYWPCNPINQDYKYSPIEYINNLLGHECKGSLVHYLKSKELCISLNVSVFESDKYLTLVELNIELTQYGFNNINLILQNIYCYLEKIKKEGITKWQYEEYKKIAHYKFDYIDKVEPIEYVENLASNMCRYELHKIIINKFYWANYSEKAKNIILKYLQYYDISNMILVISSKKNQNDKKFLIEKWYKTKYNYSKFDNIINIENLDLRLPMKNKYLPHNIKLFPCPNKIKYPTVIKKELGLTIWHKQDYTFMTPNVAMQIILKNNKINKNIKKYASYLIYIDLLNNYLSSMKSYCDYANSDFDISVNNNYIIINIISYSDIIKNILNKIIYYFYNFEITEKKLEFVKLSNIASLTDFYTLVPLIKISDYILNSLIHNRFYTNNDLSDSIKNISIKEVRKIQKNLRNKFECKSLIQGNYTVSQAHNLINNFDQFVDKQLKKIKTNEKIFPLLKGEEELYITKNVVSNDKNSVIITLYEINEQNENKLWIFKYCKLLIVYDLIKEKFFNQLRSIEQLGYIVNCSIVNIGTNKNKLHCLKFTIQTVSKTPDYSHKRIKKFITSFYEYLQNIDSQDFELCIENIIISLTKPFDNIYSEIDYNINKIINKLDFNIIDTYIKILKKYKKEHICKFFFNKFINKKTRKIRTLYIYGKNKLLNN
ncbi:Zn-dependent peptidase [Hokovirus HKV1]|uniref:Zn-dependent peptidase n=1 Tax=Hokovirus HKV1 TaxID=1977638 RepID=A0A1V0SH69_9VIRU|nr:Zn-dependent peptidase [Hokovirus HKV1]